MRPTYRAPANLVVVIGDLNVWLRDELLASAADPDHNGAAETQYSHYENLEEPKAT
jgi:hypothetical protein